MIHLLLVIIYMAFISLGLPDSLLGSAWPSMYTEMNVPVSYMGLVSMLIAGGTIVSSLASDFMAKKLGTGLVTALSTAMTAIALFGFSISDEYFMICLWAIPYGLGAGSIDAALNHYVSVHYESRHMSWLHCMWGVGTIIGPVIMGQVLTGGGKWNTGYFAISVIQIVLTLILFASLPLWKKKDGLYDETDTEEKKEVISPFKAIRFKGVKMIMLTFFCYCALEATSMLWVSSYMVLHNEISADKAAGLASLLFVGITLGRLISGFLTMKFSDDFLIKAGLVIIVLGSITLLLPFGIVVTLIGIILIGLGCAPVYPCIIHSTPEHFGVEKSQAIIGVQMASAYTGTCLMPPLFGIIANHISAALMPIYILILAIIMWVAHSIMVKQTKNS